MDDLELRLRTALGSSAVERGADGLLHLRPAGREPARLAVRMLAEGRHRWHPRGGGRRPRGHAGVVVHSTGLGGVLDFWPEDLVCRIGAGTTFTDLDRVLEPLGLRVGVACALPDRATLGGAFAAGDRGLAGSSGRALRELALGLTALTGDGRLLKAGARVVKNVAGYDMVRLHSGAEGAFGLVLDLIVRLQARPEASRGRWLPCSLEALPSLLPRVRRPAMAADPVAAVWLDEAASGQLELGPGPGLFVWAEGWEDSVEAWARALPAGTAEAPPASVRDFGWARRDRLLLRWQVTPSRLIHRWPALRDELAARGVSVAVAADCLGGYAVLALGPATGPGLDRVRDALTAASESTRVHLDRGLPSSAPGLAMTPGRSAQSRDLVERLKRAFDPHDLLPWPPPPAGGGHG